MTGGTKSRPVRSALADARIPVLENNAVKLGTEGRQFWLAGIGDQLAHLARARPLSAAKTTCRARWRRSERTIPSSCSFTSRTFFRACPTRVALTLAGHTHGGQIRLPFIWPAFVPSKFGERFAYGHVDRRRRHMIVSGGLGTSVVPARLGVPPEVVRIELGA